MGEQTMKKLITTCLIVLAASFLLCGCGQKCKNEEELLQDLTNSSSFYYVEGSEATGLNIIKRLTEKESKKDTVYVEINLEHEAASETRAYIMYYTNYNDGWELDGVEEYRGDDAVWKVTPKVVPSTETIMQQLIQYSNAKIDASYSEQFVNENLTDLYFFEEGKYSTHINPGELISDLEYACLARTYREFDYCDVYEEKVLNFQLQYLRSFLL